MVSGEARVTTPLGPAKKARSSSVKAPTTAASKPARSLDQKAEVVSQLPVPPTPAAPPLASQ